MSETHSTTHEAIRGRALAQWSALPQSIGRYRVRGELGRGGMGIVYDAHDPLLDRSVAIKVVCAESDDLLPEHTRRLEGEIHAASRIFDANVVTVLDAGTLDEQGVSLPYCVMERIDGPSLQELLEERGTLRREEGLRIATCIARGLAAVHRSGLVHRDLKPSNVLITAQGVPKVSDFGLCSLHREAMAGDFVALGSAHYLAPEQIRGRDVGPPADLFALGSILLRMLSGLEAFPDRSIAEHLSRVLHDEPDGLGVLDPDVRCLVRELMAKRAERRPTAEAVVQRLEALAARGDARDDASDDRQRGSATSPPPRRVRLLSWLAGSALGIAAIAAAIQLFAWRNELVLLETEIETQREQIANQLRRRHELIPELDGLLSRYLAYEREELELILGSGGDAGAAGVESAQPLDAIAQLFVLTSRGAGDQTGRQFRSLSHEVAGTQNRIALERRRYNEVVGRFNQRLRQLPWSLVAGSLEPHDYLRPAPNRPDDV